MFIQIFQVSADVGIGKESKLVEFSTQKLFQIRACVISERKAKHLDVTTMFTCTLMQTHLSANQSARAILVIFLNISGVSGTHLTLT